MLCYLATFMLALPICAWIVVSNRKKNQVIAQTQQQAYLQSSGYQTQINTCQAQVSALRHALTRIATNGIAISKIEDDLLATVPCKHGVFRISLSDIHVSRSLLFYGEWMEDEICLLRKFLKEGDVVYDIGANLGTHSIAFAKIVGEHGKVVAFEPQFSVAQLLRETIQLNGLSNVEVVQKVVCEPGKHRFKLNSEDTEKIAGNYAGVSFVNMENVDGDIPSVSLDELMPVKLQLIKIDAEGMEVNVIRGAISVINSTRPIIYSENHEKRYSAPLIRALFALGYDCYWHLVPAYHPDNYMKHTEDIWNGTGFNVNMLCLPQERKISLEGLVKVVSETEWIDDRILIDYAQDMSKYRTPIPSLSGFETF